MTSTTDWNMQAYAGAGYVAVAVDFHGSTGYGQKFTDAITGDWGGAPYIDLMKGVDYVLAQYSFIDRHHMGALGASYGGYMVNWIAGHTDRFQCIVSHDGSFDQTGMYYSTEELWFPEWEFRGTARDPVEAAVLPRREPPCAQAEEQPVVARNDDRVAGPMV